MSTAVTAGRTNAQRMHDRVTAQTKSLMLHLHPLKWQIYQAAALQQVLEDEPGLISAVARGKARRIAFAELRAEHEEEYATIAANLLAAAKEAHAAA